jgi:hypothetical protein
VLFIFSIPNPHPPRGYLTTPSLCFRKNFNIVSSYHTKIYNSLILRRKTRDVTKLSHHPSPSPTPKLGHPRARSKAINQVWGDKNSKQPQLEQSVEPKKIMDMSQKKISKTNVLLTFLCYLFPPSQTPTRLGGTLPRLPYVFVKTST